MTAGPYTSASLLPERSFTLDDLKAAMDKVKAIPKGRWILIAPDGRAWADEKPAEVLRAMMGAVPLSELLPRVKDQSTANDPPFQF